jgi:flagellar protein FlaG
MEITSTQGVKQAGDLNKVRSVSEPGAVQENKTRANHENTTLKPEKKKEKATPMEEVEKATRELNQYMDELKTSLGFSIHEKTKELMVNIINRDTKEVIKQIPPEELVTIREKMAELAGILLNERV